MHAQPVMGAQSRSIQLKPWGRFLGANVRKKKKGKCGERKYDMFKGLGVYSEIPSEM